MKFKLSESLEREVVVANSSYPTGRGGKDTFAQSVLDDVFMSVRGQENCNYFKDLEQWKCNEETIQWG